MQRHRLLAIVACMLSIVMAQPTEEQMKDMLRTCTRSPIHLPVRKPGDLNATFGPILTGEWWAEYSPKVYSTDPWIVQFENFLTEDEVKEAEKLMFENEAQFRPSRTGPASNNPRHSEDYDCVPGGCDEHELNQKIRKRASDVARMPVANFDFTKALRYKKNMFYKEHNDNHPDFLLLPSGPRIYTFFIYLTSVEKGGATSFPRLGIDVPAKRGAALFFVNTKDSNPREMDLRSGHASLEVLEGEKQALTFFMWQYNYYNFERKGCMSHDYLWALRHSGKVPQNKPTAEPPTKSVIFKNNAGAVRYIYWMHSATQEEEYLRDLNPGEKIELDCFEKQVLRIRASNETGDRNFQRYVVGKGLLQRIPLQVDKKKHAEL